MQPKSIILFFYGYILFFRRHNLNINNSYQAKLQVISSDEPDEIFPWTKDYGGLNQYFLKENNNFFLNLSYDSLANPQLKINGSEFSNMDLN
ncbi:TPA: hypothetical protein ACTN52_001362 [Campylobacter jejuni]